MRKYHEKPNFYLGQISIKVTNIEKSLAFYQKIIGFQIMAQNEREVTLSVDGVTPLLTIVQPNEVHPKENRTTGLYHFALLLPKRADLASFLRHVVNKKITIGASDHLVSEAIYLDDPDGNGIEVYCDRPASDWIWTNGEVEMTTIPLDSDSLFAENDAAWNGLPKNTTMGHIHLHVADLEETENFYVSGLGFKVVSHYPGALFVSTGGYHHHVGLNIWKGTGIPAPDENSVGLNWYTIVFANEGVRKETVKNLKNIGTQVVKYQDHYVTTDPSGNKIQLVV